MKRLIFGSVGWNSLSGSEQQAVERAKYLYEYEDYTLEDAAYKACMDIGEANTFDEYKHEEFYLDEPDVNNVISYLVSNN